MKLLRLLVSVAGLALGVSALAAGKPSTPSPVEVTFENPADFTDFTTSHYWKDRDQDHLMAEFREHLQTVAGRRLAAGQKLEVKFTDIDLAGGYEPWRVSPQDDVRIVKELYPPRVTLEFRLLNADGSVAAQGQRKLSSLGFMSWNPFPTSDPLRFDKEMLSQWVRDELPAPKK